MNTLKSTSAIDANSITQLQAELNAIEKTALFQDNGYVNYHNELKKSVTKIRENATIEEQRESFMDTSNAMIALLENYKSNAILYKQFCPMANHDKGAYWISAEDQIRNPYFGKVMYQCGVSEPMF